MADNGQIIINYGEFEKHANKIEKKNTDMRTTLDAIQRKIADLKDKGNWESNSAETIREKITNMTGRFESYQQVVNSYVKFIRNAAAQSKNLETTINSNASQFK